MWVTRPNWNLHLFSVVLRTCAKKIQKYDFEIISCHCFQFLPPPTHTHTKIEKLMLKVATVQTPKCKNIQIFLVYYRDMTRAHLIIPTSITFFVFSIWRFPSLPLQGTQHPPHPTWATCAFLIPIFLKLLLPSPLGTNSSR